MKPDPSIPSVRRNERTRKRLQRKQTPVKESGELLPLIERLHWYALRTPPSKEFIAQEVLTQRGLVTYCPTDKRWRKRNAYQKEKALIGYAMIPRTVFVGFEPLDGRGNPLVPRWLNVFSMPCVSSVVGVKGEPMKLDNKGMSNLITKYKNGIQRPKEEKHMQTGKEFAAGDMVRIADGPFDGFVVPVHELRGKEARVFVELFGARHEVTIPLLLLEAA